MGRRPIATSFHRDVRKDFFAGPPAWFVLLSKALLSVPSVNRFYPNNLKCRSADRFPLTEGGVGFDPICLATFHPIHLLSPYTRNKEFRFSWDRAAHIWLNFHRNAPVASIRLDQPLKIGLDLPSPSLDYSSGLTNQPPRATRED